LFRNREVVVVGGGDKAVEEAIFLSKYASKITLIHRRKNLRATEILQEQIHAIPKIHFLLDAKVEEIVGESRIEAVMVRDIATDELTRLNCQGVFVFIGIRPNTDYLKGIVSMDEAGFIITDNQMQTSKPGIFACGDCREKNLYQVIASCGEGASAAHSVHTYLLNKKA
jgi:thioredoxin reductase (NADPH)